MFNYFQRLGKSLLLPIATLPICAILLGIGYILAPASLGASGEITGVGYTIGLFLTTAGGALINNMGILFAIGVGVGMAKKNDGTAGVAALVSWLVFTTILSVDSVSKIILVDDVTNLAFKSIANPFIGILSGLIGSTCFNAFGWIKLPDFLAFFSGKRFVAIASTLISIAIAFAFLWVWPIIFSGLVAFGTLITNLKGFGVGLFQFANRMLIPVGLHHALNNVFWFDTVGIGDLTNFWAGKTSADVSWDLGMYMSGFFPCIMFGIPGACLAMILLSKNKKATIGILGSIALCAFLCGVTEPFEFLFMFVAFPLYIIYALLCGVFGIITYFVGFRAGFSFSAGLIDLVFSSTLPAAENTWMIIPLGLVAFVVYFVVFYFYIKIFKVPVPGSGEITEAAKKIADSAKKFAEKATKDKSEFALMAESLLEAVGGKENIESCEHCITRLRLVLKDAKIVDEDAVMKCGASGIVRPAKNACQIVIGTKVQFVYDEFEKLIED